MAKIISIVGEKGGTGKSTLAQSLAVYSSKLKGLDTTLVDADAQETTTDWADERNKNSKISPINIIQKTGFIVHTLKDLSKRYEVIIVDCGGQDSEAMRSALIVSDIAIFPFRPKRRDLKTLIKMEKVLKEAMVHNELLKYRALMTQCPTLPSQYPRIDQAKSACASFGLEPLQNITYHRNAYDDCDENGLTVLELDDEKAKEEIKAIGDEIWEILK